MFSFRRRSTSRKTGYGDWADIIGCWPGATVKVVIMHSWIRKNRVRIIVVVSILTTLGLAGMVNLSWNYFKSMRPLVERLGFTPGDRLLIVNADDAGLCPEANQAVIETLNNGMVTSATVMAPTPAAKDIAAEAARNPKLDLGIHLTHTCEWKSYRWQPLLSAAQAPDLRRPDGTMWADVGDVQSHCSSWDAYREGKAQIDQLMTQGLQPTHIDSHVGAMQTKISYFLQYLRLAWQYDLPARMPSAETLDAHHAGWLRHLARMLGIVHPDYLILTKPAPNQTVKDFWLDVLQNLPPGVTELYIHPAQESDLLKKITGNWQRRVAEYRLFLNDPDIRRTLQDRRIILIGYRPLFNLQRGIQQ